MDGREQGDAWRARRVSQMASAMFPSLTTREGDIMFVSSTGEHRQSSELRTAE
jgi:hypothetical protein